MTRGRPRDVAIVGMACRFPGAADLCAFWENLLAGRDATGDVPPDRWDPAVFFDPDSTDNDRVPCRRGGFLDAPIPFDPAAHGIMPIAVDGGEPEQFLVLDAARAALADAGLPGGVADGRRVEVVVGRGNYFNRGNLTRLQHGRIVAQTLAILRGIHPEWDEATLAAIRADLKASLPPFDAATVPGQLTSATAGRVADRLDLSGASYVVDAASASALVALDLGSRALASGRADLALVGAVYLTVDVDFAMVFSRLGALSRRGQARPFARSADGTLPGEGAGAVVLKRLADAERDGDRIYAVVRGVGVASDGRASGLAAPSVRGHARAMRRAYRRAGIDPATVGRVEGHGLGVPASDRAELRALRAVFPKPERGTRSLGAVGATIGHAMPAAGMAGLIAAALSLYHRALPPTPHADDPHPLLADPESPFALNPRLRPWIHAEAAHPRRAGVNAFGFAGMNAHAVLEEHRPSADGLTAGCLPRWDSEAILLGAPDRPTWLDLSRALIDRLDRGPDVDLKDLAYTLNTGQPAFPFRVGLVAGSVDDLKERLRFVSSRLAEPSCRSIRDARGAYFWEEPLAPSGKLAFLFPGEGSQYAGMLADLCLHFPEVRALFDTADRVAREQGHARLPSEHVFGAAPGDAPALWAIGTAINIVLTSQWALYQLLIRLGLRPDAVVGHSSGEILALGAAGVVRVDGHLEEQLGRLGTVFERLEGSGAVPEAALVAVAADRAKVEAACREAGIDALVAIDNCPHQVVVAAPPDRAEPLLALLRGRGMVSERLPFARAYHTPAFGPATGPVRDFFARLPMGRPRRALYSCALAGRMPDDPEAVRRLAVDQWTRPVAFRVTVARMHADGVRLFVEVGARGSLTGFVEDTLRGRPAFAVAANLPRRSGLAQLNHLVASLFAQGVTLKPEFLYARRRPCRVDLSADAPRHRPAPALAVGFPEMRLSPGLAASLRSRGADRPTTGPIEVPAPAIRPEEADGAMLSFLETMDAFLNTQRSVMDAYLEALGLPGALSSTSWEGRPVAETSAPDHAREDVSQAPVAVAISPTAPELGRILREQVGRRTGYPLEMIGLDLDLEADLGIDSIKRVEILGDLQARGLLAAGLDLDRLTRCKSLRQVLDVLEGAMTAPIPPSPEPGPWVGEIRSLVPGRELVAVRRLDAATDPVAEHHTLGGRRVSALDPGRKGLPVVPFTVMAEMLAQAAAVLVPGRILVALRDVQAHRWIRYEDDPIALEIRATRDPERPDGVRVAIWNRGIAGASGAKGPDGPVVEGAVIFGDERPAGAVAGPFAMTGAAPRRFTAEELYRDQWLFHGPALRALTRVGLSSPSGIEGTLRVLPRRGLLRPSDRGGLLTDAIVLDAFTHLLGCWGLDLPEGDVIFPLRLAELMVFGADPPEGAEIHCRIAITHVERHRVRADAELVGPDGRVWMRLAGWEDWRFYWPARYRDVFRAPDRVLVGEPLELPDREARDLCAVWLEPPADMGRPVWRDVLEATQLAPEERAALRDLKGPERRRALRLWGRVAAKEAVRRLWLDGGGPPVYPADLLIEPDPRGRPIVRALAEPERSDLPAVSIAHTEGVAVALAAADPRARVGIDVERVVAREAGFEAVAFSDAERALLDTIAGDDRPGWIARLWCAKEAVAKATAFGMIIGPASVEVVRVEPDTGAVAARLGADLAAACPELGAGPLRVLTSRRGEYAWAWTLGEEIGS